MANKICHVSTTFIYKAGSCRRTYYILKALVKAGYETTLVVGRDFEPHPSWDLAGITVVRIPELVKYIDPIKEIVACRRMHRFFKATGPDIVHTHLAKAGVLGRLTAWLAGVPHIVHTVHGPTFAETLHPVKKAAYRGLERICGSVTDYFVFVGEELKQEYKRSRVCTEKNAVVIRSGRPKSDYDIADALTSEQIATLRNSFCDDRNVFLLGYVARLVPSKNQAAAIRMLALVRAGGVNAYLVLIGEAHLAEEKNYAFDLRRMCRELGVEPYVHFTGYRPDVLLCMKAMNVLILTSRYEGLPNVAIEAGIVFRPMVSFDVSGVHEVVEDGVTGYIVGQGDIEGMAHRVAGLALDKKKAEAMGVKARKKIEGLYDLDVMVGEKLTLYENIIHNIIQ